jgi:hypothetical protein
VEHAPDFSSDALRLALPDQKTSFPADTYQQPGLCWEISETLFVRPKSGMQQVF